MPHLVDPGTDFKRWTRGLELVTVISRDPDTGATLASNASVQALRTPLTADEAGVEGGTVGYKTVAFTLPVNDVSFTLKERDAIVDADGATWIITGAVKTEAFGKLCRLTECTRQRSSTV